MTIGAVVGAILLPILSGLVGGVAMGTIFTAVLGLIVEFMYSGSLGIIKLVLSNKILNFTNLWDLLPYEYHYWKVAFMIVALSAIIGFSTFGILKSIVMADSKEAESPFEAIKRIIISIIILVIFLSIFFFKDGTNLTLFGKFMSVARNFVNIGDKLDQTTNHISAYVSKEGISGYIFVCILGFMLTRGVITASITFIERMVTLVILVFVGPLAIAAYSARDTEIIFKSWMKAMFGTILAIFLSLGLFRIFVDQMYTWNKYEAEMTVQSTETVEIPWDGTDTQKDICLADGEVTIQKCYSESGVYSGGNCVTRTWTKKECEAGVKKVEVATSVSSEQLDFFGTVNTYRLILAIAWITLCANSEKFINQLGLTSIANGDMARNFMMAARQAVGFIQSGIRTGQFLGSQVGRIATSKSGNPKGMNQQRIDRAMAEQQKNAMKGSIGKMASVATNPKDFARQQAKNYGLQMGKSMALNKMPMSELEKSNRIAGSGLFDSKGELLKGSYHEGNNSEGAELCRIAKTQMQRSYDSTNAAMNRINSASGTGKYVPEAVYKSNGSHEGYVSSTLSDDLNTTYLNDVGFHAREKDTTIMSRGTDEKHQFGTIDFSGTYEDSNGVKHELDGATFVRSEDIGRFESYMKSDDNNLSYNSRQETEGGVIYYNTNEDKTINSINKTAEKIDSLSDDISALGTIFEDINEDNTKQEYGIGVDPEITKFFEDGQKIADQIGDEEDPNG